VSEYEIIDHTADIGIKVKADSIAELFSRSAYAMFDIIAGSGDVALKEVFNIDISAVSIEELLVGWLRELLYLYETKRVLFKKFIVQQMVPLTKKGGKGYRLKAEVSGEKLNLARHEIKTEVKAVTYHQLSVAKKGNAWTAQVILDI